MPLYTITAAILFVALAVLAAIFTPERNQSMTIILIGMVVTTVPSLIASAYAERTSRDVRNGVVEHKAKRGAIQALQETGVTDVVDANKRGEATELAMKAIAQLLKNTEVHINEKDTTS